MSNPSTKTGGLTQVAILGAYGRGKTTLLSALSTYTQKELKTPGAESVRPDEAESYFIEYDGVEFEQYSYDLVLPEGTIWLTDFPEHHDFKKALSSNCYAFSGAIVVVDSLNEVSQVAKKQIKLIRDKGVNHIIGFVNKTDVVDDDEEMVELAEYAITDAIYPYPSDESRVFSGSALQAVRNGKYSGIKELYDELRSIFGSQLELSKHD